MAPVLAVGRAGYFYPRSPCGERRNARPETRRLYAISIHALLAESDWSGNQQPAGTTNFYPRSPCGERPQTVTKWASSAKFLSTLSLRRATFSARSGFCRPRYFYPRSPCGERRVHYDNYNLHCVISIHALLAESDGKTHKLDMKN